MKPSRFSLSLAPLLALIPSLHAWEMAEVPLSSPWAEQVDPTHFLPEYPRPGMVRDAWLNLNGLPPGLGNPRPLRLAIRPLRHPGSLRFPTGLVSPQL